MSADRAAIPSWFFAIVVARFGDRFLLVHERNIPGRHLREHARCAMKQPESGEHQSGHHRGYRQRDAPLITKLVERVQAAGQVRSDLMPTDIPFILFLLSDMAQFAREVLAPGGAFLCKDFQGGTEATLLAELKRDFESVKHVKPPASRTDSAELYLLARGFRGS